MLTPSLAWSADALDRRAFTGPLKPGHLHEVIDLAISAELEQQGVAPAEPASPENLARRLTLDLVGRIPTVREVHQFVEDHAADRRGAVTKWIDRLLESDGFAEQLARRLDWQVTRGDGSVQPYLRDAIAAGRGWDEIFQDLILADLRENEDALPYLKARVKDSERLTNEVSISFFGVNISCAKCHDHPLVDDWKQDHFYGMKSFFDRLLDNGGFVAERDYGVVTFTTIDGSEKTAKLLFLSGFDATPKERDSLSSDERAKLKKLYRELKASKERPPPPKNSLRLKLVDTALRDGENAFFAKSIVNRLWHEYLGHGLVMPLDQMHSENPPSHPDLLEDLAADLIAHDYDLQRLVRAIVLSDAYQRSSIWSQPQRPDPSLFAVAQVRPLTPAQLSRSLRLASQRQQPADSPDEAQRIAAANKLADGEVLAALEQPETNFSVTSTEALFFSNSPAIEEMCMSGGLIEELEELPHHQAIELAVWSVLSRAPDEAELRMLTRYLRERTERPRAALGQVVWALLTSSEFRFNH